MQEQKTGRDEQKKRSMLGFGRSRNAYRRHFEGYEEYRETDAKGRVRVRRIYTGIYYTLDMPASRRVLYQVCFALLWAAQAVLTGYLATRYAGANSCWYVVFPQCGAAAGILIIGLGLFNWYISSARMTAGDWHSAFVNLQNGSLAAAICDALTAVSTLLYVILNGTDVAAHVSIAAGFFALGALAWYMRRRTARMTFIETPSEEKPPAFDNEEPEA